MGTYVGPPRPNRRERRARAQQRARINRGMHRATTRAMREQAQENAKGAKVRWWDADWRPVDPPEGDYEVVTDRGEQVLEDGTTLRAPGWNG